MHTDQYPEHNIVAVMDLGTNTFHLMIADVAGTEPSLLERGYEATKLGEGGIGKGIIQPEAFARGIASMKRFKAIIATYPVNHTRAIATSMLRNAANGQEFIDAVNESTGIEIELIDGQQEAKYIYEGVKLSGALHGQTSLIMDIGGGSVEFILCDKACILWKQSFEIGALRLLERFMDTDPISTEAIKALETYAEGVLQPVFEAAKGMAGLKLIGSAGAFETYAELIAMQHNRYFDARAIMSYDYDMQEFIAVTDNIIASTHAERVAMKGIIPLRIDMIVVASVLTRFVMRKLGVQSIGMSTYALKEGVLAEYTVKA